MIKKIKLNKNVKLECFTEKSFRRNAFYSFALTPSITINYQLSYSQKELNFDIFWLLWFVGMGLIIKRND